jgi:protocatechuate 3,4-dioxygenase beta subunit
MRKLSIALSILVLPSAFHSVQAQTAETKAGTVTVSGRVVMKGETAQGVLVYLHPISSPTPSNPDAYLRARTDDGGHFRITGVAAGDYFIIPLAPGFVYSGGDEPGQRRKTLKVSEGVNVENIDVGLYRGGVITGRVVDLQGRPLVGKYLLLSKFDDSGWSSPNTSYGASLEMYETDDRGVYRFYGLPLGRYLVSVGFPPSAGAVTVSRSGTYYPRTFHPKAANESEAKAIEVTEGSESVGVDITVLESKPARSISGRVIDADTGQPVEGIEIAYNAMSDSGRYINYWRSSGGISGAQGEFSLKDMAPGKYQLGARLESESEFFSDPAPCDLSDGDVAGIEIKVRRGGSISGVVVIEGTDDPKALAKLPELYLYVNVWRDDSDAQRRDNPKVNADGSFQVRGLPQSRVYITYDPKSKGQDFSLARVEHNGAVVRDVIWAGPGKHVTGVRVVLAYNSRQQ